MSEECKHNWIDLETELEKMEIIPSFFGVLNHSELSKYFGCTKCGTTIEKSVVLEMLEKFVEYICKLGRLPVIVPVCA